MNFEKQGACHSGGRVGRPLISHSGLWLPHVHVKVSFCKVLKPNFSWLEVGNLHSCLRHNLKAHWVVSRLEKSIYHFLWFHCIQKKSDIPKADISKAQQLTLKHFRWLNSTTGYRLINVFDLEAPCPFKKNLVSSFTTVLMSTRFNCPAQWTTDHFAPFYKTIGYYLVLSGFAASKNGIYLI